MSTPAKAHLALLFVNLVYGLNYSFAKYVMPAYIRPVGFVTLRAVATLALFLACLLFMQREKIRYRDIPVFAGLGLLGVLVTQVLFLKGLDLTTPINASIIMISNPVLVLIFSAIIFHRRVGLKKTAGIASGIIGAALVIAAGKEFSFGMDRFKGDFFIFICSVAWAAFLVLSKPVTERYSPLTVITWVFAFGLIFVLPFGYREFSEIRWGDMNINAWAAILFVIVLSTFANFLLNIYALKILSPALVSYYIYIQPILTAWVAILMGQDHITVLKCLAVILTFAGVYLVSNESPVKNNRSSK